MKDWFMKKGRPIILILLCIAVLFFTNDFGRINLEKNAIIVAIGVDFDGEEYRISCQVAASEAPAQGNAPSQKQTVVTGVGRTPASAFDNMSQRTGWHPNLTFCYMIIMGEKTLEIPFMKTIDYFFRSEELNDGALICACGGTAEDLLKAQTPLDNVSAFALLKIIFQEDNKSDKILSINLKTLLYQYFNKSNGNYMTYLTYQREETGSLDPEQGNVVYDTSQAVLFENDDYRQIINQEQISAFQFLIKDVKQGGIEVYEVNEDGHIIDRVEMIVESDRAKARFYFNDGIPCVSYELNPSLVISHRETTDINVWELTNAQQVSDALCRAVEDKMTGMVEDFLQVIREAGTDIIRVEENFYKFLPKEYRAYTEQHQGENFIEHVSFSIKVSASSKF